MQSPIEALRHESAALYRLVDFVSSHLQEQESTHTYLDSTKDFFLHVQGLARKTKKDILRTLRNAEMKPKRIANLYRPAVTIFTDKWATLQTFVKPATDADTLSIPGPLVDLAERSLQAIKGFSKCTIVVLLTPELMYFQNATNNRAELPESTVLVEIPYSQGPGFFTNLIIFHEIAHFVFSRANSGTSAAMRSVGRLLSKVDEVIEGQPRLASKDVGGKLWAKERLSAWTEEMFCDLFALRVVGPAFSFAMIDLLRLAGLMKDGTEIAFDLDHPAPAFRMKMHRDLLKSTGWWEEIATLETEHVSLIEHLSGLGGDQYRLKAGDEPIRSRLVNAFVADLMPAVVSAVTSVTKGATASVEDFAGNRQAIEKCLMNGIVPSALIQRPSLSPRPVSIINAAYCFYLTSIPALMSKLIGQDPQRSSDRKNWIQKIESWALKSLEDYELIKGSHA